MGRRPKIKTKFIIWEKGNPNNVPRDAEVRRWIYQNEKEMMGLQHQYNETMAHQKIRGGD